MYPRQQAGVHDRPIRFRDVAAVRAGCSIASRGSRQYVCRFCLSRSECEQLDYEILACVLLVMEINSSPNFERKFHIKRTFRNNRMGKLKMVLIMYVFVLFVIGLFCCVEVKC